MTLRSNTDSGSSVRLGCTGKSEADRWSSPSLLFLSASGPGSGIIISYLSQLLRRRGYFLAADINPRACQTTRQTMRANGVVGDVLQGNLTDCIATRMEHQLVSQIAVRSTAVPH